MKKVVWMALVLAALVSVSLGVEIPMEPVESSFICRIGYDAATETLAVQMHNCSDIFHYQGVPAKMAAEFRSAESVGRYFVDHIKGRYESERVE